MSEQRNCNYQSRYIDINMNSYWNKCNKTAKYTCPKCDKFFCYNHLTNHGCSITQEVKRAILKEYRDSQDITLDPDIMTKTDLPENMKKSKKIHYNYGLGLNLLPYCKKLNARYFANDWKRVDCKDCISTKAHDDAEARWKIIRRQNEAQRMCDNASDFFIKELYIPDINESLQYFIERAYYEKSVEARNAEYSNMNDLIYFNDISFMEQNGRLIVTFMFRGGDYDEDQSKFADLLDTATLTELLVNEKDELERHQENKEILEELLKKRLEKIGNV